MAKKVKELKDIRNRSYRLLLYADNVSHMSALERIKASFDFVAIMHDRDVKQQYDVDNMEEDAEVEVGGLKKAHYHVIIRFKNPRYLVSIARDLGIEPRFMKECNNMNGALEYLIHKNDADKCQYDFDDVFGTFTSRLKELLNSDDKTECEKVKEVIMFINGCGLLSVTELSMWCAENGYWDVYRRSGMIFMRMLEEHNEKVRRMSIDEDIKTITCETAYVRSVGV